MEHYQAATNEKVRILFDNYRENKHVSVAQEEIESSRSRGRAFALASSIGIVYLNERRRLYKGNRYFNLIGPGILLVFAPFLFSNAWVKYYETNRIHDAWRVHKNRVDKGLGGTYATSGNHHGKEPDFYKNLSMAKGDIKELITGIKQEAYIASPFMRWHQSYKNYPGNLGYIDDHSLYTHDQFERFKKF